MNEVVITNTKTGKKELLPVHDKKKLSLYVCGITPYDYAHIGHGRCYVMFDVLYRLAMCLGYEVTYCRNVTDIDDKLMKKAHEQYANELEYYRIAEYFTGAFHEDMRSLNCLPPTHEPRVTQCIPDIIAFIEKLIEKKHAYSIDGDVYFSIESFASYGSLAKRELDDVCAGARVAINDKKRNPLDFALWKSEPEGTFWQSLWGWGRPGWHIECSAMAHRYLPHPIDIHGGGMDLIFPHHENERAQSNGVLNEEFVTTWMHIAFVRSAQEKMSKSLGNFFTLRQTFEQYDPMVVRFMILSHHYRSPLDFCFNELEMAHKAYQKITRAFSHYDDPVVDATRLYETIEKGQVASRMITFLCDDLNTQGMIGLLFENLKVVADDETERRAVRALLRDVLGLPLAPFPEKIVEYTAEIKDLIELREKARREKDWNRADEIRDQLKHRGIDVHDTKS